MILFNTIQIAKHDNSTTIQMILNGNILQFISVSLRSENKMIRITGFCNTLNRR